MGAPRDDPTRTRVADYVLGRRLGVGGMGAVYAARSLETGAEVAIKVISAHASLEDRERFQREGEAQAAVDKHPNVLRVRSAGLWGGRPYLVMDLATGGTLEDRLKREGALDPGEAAQIVRDLALGLAHVHARGVLHRDIKPANVLLDEAGAPMLVDFGLARVAGASTLTETGAVMGTPAYMPPEQACGEREVMGPRSDVYSLGGVLYALLAGRPPFVGSSPLVVLSQVVNAPPEPLTRLRLGLDPALAAICLRCLEKEPAARPESAQALAGLLDRWLSGESQGSPRGAFVSAGAGLVLLAIGVAALATSFAPPPSPAQPAPPVDSPRPTQPPALTAGRDGEPSRPDPVDRGEQSRPEPWTRPLAILGHGGPEVVRAVFAGDEVVLAGRRWLLRWRLADLEGEGRDRLVPASTLALPDAYDGLISGLCSDGATTVIGHWERALLLVRGGVVREVAGGVSAMRLAPGGKTFVAAQQATTNTVARFDLASGEQIGPVYGHPTDTVIDLAFSFDGARVATLAGRRVGLAGLSHGRSRGWEAPHVSVYDVVSGELLGEEVHAMPGRCLSYTPEGELIVGTTWGLLIRLDGVSAERLGQIEDPALRSESDAFAARRAQRGSLRGVVFDPRAARMYSLSRSAVAEENELVVWSWPDVKVIARASISASASALEISADGRYLLVSTRRGQAELWATE